MTVTYTAEVATCTKIGSFLKLLFRWKGSIYKLIWTDLVAFLVAYYALSFIYRFALSDAQKRVFEIVVHYCKSYSSLIPLSFVLGFYVQIIMQRWWEQYITIPWPDTIAVFISAHIHGENERARLMRRTIMRYVCLCQAIVFTMIAPKVKKRFPTLTQLVDIGLMLDNEKNVFDSLNESFPKILKHWMPIVWAASIVTRARREGLIRDDFAVKTIIDELNKFRGQCGTLLLYDSINVPLVYTQVVTIAVYSFFLSTCIGEQWTERLLTKDDHENGVDFYVPFFTTLQFFFYMGWLKVAESLINPFGEDDDDFEVNWMIDRNLQVSYLIVDEMHQSHPDLVKDQYWDEVFPSELPYDGEVKREDPPEPSTAKLGEKLATMSTIRIDRKSAWGTSISSGPTENADNFKERMSAFKSSIAFMRDLGRASAYNTAVTTPISTKPSPLEPVSKISSQDKSVRLSTNFVPESDLQSTDGSDRPRRIITDGIFESSLDSFSGSYDDVIDQLDEDGEEMEPTKDEFELLKEKRARKRGERQRLRFVKHLEDASNMKADHQLTQQPKPETSELDIEEFDSAEDMMNDTNKDTDFQSFNDEPK